MKLREMNDWKVSNDTLKLGVELGRGSFGIVMRAAASRLTSWKIWAFAIDVTE